VKDAAPMPVESSAPPSRAAVDQPRPAASVILLRDAADGPEVLLLRRHGQSEVLAGNFVFPGGKVDRADAGLDTALHLDAPLQLLHERLGEAEVDPATAAGLYVAAVRETFEESGLLLAPGISPAQCAEAAARLADGMDFNAVLAALGLRLQCSALVPWSRWITPVQSLHKRFDTRFFAVRAPAEGVARHDGREMTETVWLRPRRALESYWDGAMSLAPPQLMTLAHLTRFGTVEAALDDARRRRPALIEPHILFEMNARVMCYPGDESHPVRERAMPGPLRLVTRGPRVEPQDGFEAFFG
jgi:8-oxo-dGTP pyrophosphatase MutT (NUDIX family)